MAVAIDTMRADDLHDPTQHLVGELAETAISGDPASIAAST